MEVIEGQAIASQGASQCKMQRNIVAKGRSRVTLSL